MAMEASAGGLASLFPSFSDQTHLEFYQRRTSSLPSPSLRPPPPPLRSVCSVAPLRAAVSQSVGCPPPLVVPEQACWMKELAELKLQMKQKKKEVKSLKKQEKKKMKMQMKQKGLAGKKKCGLESTSSSESSDEECATMSMATLRKERPVFSTFPARFELEGSAAAKSPDELILTAADSITETNHATFESQIPVSATGTCCNEETGSLRARTSIHRQRAEFPTKSNASNYPFMQAPNRVEVCTGGKCRKAGSGQLLSALSAQIPPSSDVVAVPCKCMGQCAMAMNVKVFKEDTNPQHHSHVRAEDANSILNHHYGLGRPPSGLPVLEPHDWTRVPASTKI